MSCLLSAVVSLLLVLGEKQPTDQLSAEHTDPQNSTSGTDVFQFYLSMSSLHWLVILGNRLSQCCIP